MFLGTQPERFDVIVTDNLFGDILTDLGAAMSGGIGLAAWATSTRRGRYRPCSSPYTAARRTSRAGKADPAAAILSAALLCEHLGHTEAATKIEQAVAEDLVDASAPGGPSTAEIGDAIAESSSPLGPASAVPGLAWDCAKLETMREIRHGARGRATGNGPADRVTSMIRPVAPTSGSTSA